MSHPDPGAHVQQVSIEEAIRSLRSDASGLANAEAARRLVELGPNRIERAARTPIVVRLLRELTHFFAVILWAAALLAFLAEYTGPGQGMGSLGLAIVAVIAVNGLFSFWQEYRAEQAFLTLQRLLPHAVTALREGAAVRVAAETLVPGDMILVDAGDSIPADCRVTQAFGLRVNLATVTGESHPVSRDARPSAEGDLLRSSNALLAGTTVVSGSARALVLATGMRTEFGRIARLAQATEEAPSPLQRELARISRVIAMLAVAAGVIVFVIGEAIGVSLRTNAVFAIGIIVANVPEGLLPTLTLAMAMASRRMAGRNVLVRRLASVETLGAASVICTDKTGTLTENRMAVRAIHAYGRPIDPAVVAVDAAAVPRRFLECARCCHDLKEAGRPGARWLGDPMEIALIEFAAPVVSDEAPKIDELAFDSDRRRLVTVHRGRDGPVLYAKGALDALLPLCRSVSAATGALPLDAERRAALAAAQSAMALTGLRVLAFAHRDLADGYDPARLEEDLVLDALVGFEDPPRPEVPFAIERCRRAGIRVVMVTGDHPETAVAVGREIGLLPADPVVVTGSQLERMSDAQLWASLESPHVLFARVTADHKLRIVTALQRRQEVVAVTGDGVNDAPALRAAEIGIAMGISGTDVARQAADMVLLDDNFASIVSAVEEGRAVYDNIRKFLTYILTSNVPELVPYLAFAFFNVPLALTVLQILAVDLGTDLVPALGLGAERAEPGVMDRRPRSRDDRVLTPALLGRAYLFLGSFEAVAAMTAFLWTLPVAGYAAATTACLGAIVLMQIVNVQLCRSDQESVLRSARRWNGLIAAGVAVEVALMLLIAYTPAGNLVFGTAPIAAWVWISMLPLGVVMLVCEELRKWVVRKRPTPEA